jgi:hypothetical protein
MMQEAAERGCSLPLAAFLDLKSDVVDQPHKYDDRPSRRLPAKASSAAA